MEKKSRDRREARAGSRRRFLQNAGTGIATVTGIALLPRSGHAAPFDYILEVDRLRAQGNQAVAGAVGGDAAILNFALLLERLEATFYNTNGDKGYLTTSGTVTNPGTTTPGTTVPGTGTSTGTETGTGTSTGTGTATGTETTTGTADQASAHLVVLKSMVDEIRAHENSHVALLEQTLGANANPAPSFQNLDAPTLDQFLVMAQMFEDVGTSAYLGQAPLIQDKGILATAAGIMDVEARHAGGLRAYRKLVSTAEGGDPNLTLTEDGQSVNPARTQAQVLAIIQPYLVGASTGTGTGTNPGTGNTGTGTGTGNTGTGNTGTGTSTGNTGTGTTNTGTGTGNTGTGNTGTGTGTGVGNTGTGTSTGTGSTGTGTGTNPGTTPNTTPPTTGTSPSPVPGSTGTGSSTGTGTSTGAGTGAPVSPSGTASGTGTASPQTP